jgi:hypothetical protein
MMDCCSRIIISKQVQYIIVQVPYERPALVPETSCLDAVLDFLGDAEFTYEDGPPHPKCEGGGESEEGAREEGSPTAAGVPQRPSEARQVLAHGWQKNLGLAPPPRPTRPAKPRKKLKVLAKPVLVDDFAFEEFLEGPRPRPRWRLEAALLLLGCLASANIVAHESQGYLEDPRAQATSALEHAIEATLSEPNPESCLADPPVHGEQGRDLEEHNEYKLSLKQFYDYETLASGHGFNVDMAIDVYRDRVSSAVWVLVDYFHAVDADLNRNLDWDEFLAFDDAMGECEQAS